MFSVKTYRFPLAVAAVALAAAVVATSGTPAKAACFDNGVLIIRSGPGQGHPARGAIPQRIALSGNVPQGECRRADDGISQNPFCWVTYGGVSGWASACGLR